MNRKKDLSAAAIEEWKKDLPFSDLTETTRSLYILFEDIRSTSLSSKQRYEALCALRPTIGFLEQSLSKFYSRQDVLTEQQILISMLAEGLYQEMFLGFKTIINESSHSIFKGKLLMVSLQNAMHYCAALFFHAYQQHRQPNPGLWLEMHSLYLLAQKKHLANLPLPKVPEWNYQLKNLEQTYKHCLLFVLSSPYRLRRDHVIYLIYALEAWTPLLSFSKTDADNALFIVDFESDAPPQYATLTFHPRGQFCYLHLEKVNRRLYKLINYRRISQSKEGKENKDFTDAECKLPISFLEFLLNAWQHMAERASARRKVNTDLSACLSIASAHWYIQHQENPNQATSEESAPPPTYQVDVVDESEGGYCLKWSEKVPSNLQSGEIIGLLNEDPDQKFWSIGTIRWIKQEKDGSTLIGVQILNDRGVAATAKLAESETSHPVAVLISPNTRDKPTTLITPSLPFKPGQEVDILYMDKHYMCSLQRTYALSPSYQEFELEFTMEPIVFDEPKSAPHVSKAE